MKRSNHRAGVLLWAAALMAAACDTSDVAGPAQDVPAANLTLQTLGKVVAPGDLDAAQAIIGPLGGALSINGGAFRLIVPPGAVLSPTHFTMRRVSTVHAQVDLTATSLNDLAQPNDVGNQGFLVPVLLRISYGGTEVNPFGLRIAEVEPDGDLIPVPSLLDLTLRQVVGVLPHFSGYVMASN